MRLSRRYGLVLLGALAIPGWLIGPGIGGRFDPKPPQTPAFLARAQTREAHGVRVTAAAKQPPFRHRGPYGRLNARTLSENCRGDVPRSPNP